MASALVEQFGPTNDSEFDAESYLHYLRRSNDHWWDDSSNSIPWVFRGQRDATWGLIPSAGRPLSSNKLLPLVERMRSRVEKAFDKWSTVPSSTKEQFLLVAAHQVAIREFILLARELKISLPNVPKNISATHPMRAKYLDGEHFAIDSIRNDESDQAITLWGMDFINDISIGLAQHHGVPTFLLDWSTDPVTAAHFASADWAKNQTKDIAVWAFATDRVLAHPFCRNKWDIDRQWSDNGRLYRHFKGLLPAFTEQLPGQNNYLDAQSGKLSYICYPGPYWTREGGYPDLASIVAAWDLDSVRQKFVENSSWLVDDHEREQLAHKIAGGMLKKIVLKARHVPRLQMLLRREGVTDAHMKPQLDTVAKTALAQLGIVD